jgi:hypothetical protein
MFFYWAKTPVTLQNGFFLGSGLAYARPSQPWLDPFYGGLTRHCVQLPGRFNNQINTIGFVPIKIISCICAQYYLKLTRQVAACRLPDNILCQL